MASIYSDASLSMDDFYGTSLPVAKGPDSTTAQASGPVGSATSPSVPMLAMIGLLVALRLLWEYGEKG